MRMRSRRIGRPRWALGCPECRSPIALAPLSRPLAARLERRTCPIRAGERRA
jgi:hypothetical protein